MNSIPVDARPTRSIFATLGVQCVVLSWQHQQGISLAEIHEYLRSEIVDKVVPVDIRTKDFRYLLNPAGTWTVGGPKGDTGLTGRKIIVDLWAAPH